ncbi:MAG: hypothetical protein QOH88_3439 [Verrucomicrobiota bacterium]
MRRSAFILLSTAAAALLLAQTAVAGAPSTWSNTGSLGTGHAWGTSTLLSSGKMLVVGGPGANAELYDPVSGTWSATGSMAVPRQFHTATLLPNGKVLVAGGNNALYNSILSYEASAELYDPATGTWAVTGSLAPRQYHTATLLPNGKVLVTGGEDWYGIIATAQLYDPATGNWTATGSLNHNRGLHSATLLPSSAVLPNGAVLVAGYNGIAELYDPVSGIWTDTGSLIDNRNRHTATLLANGKVLVAGGSYASAELYDPVTGTWTATGGLDQWGVGDYATATLLPNGKALFVGGRNAGPTPGSAELYDPASGTWTATGSLAAQRWAQMTTLLPNGQVLVAGGVNVDSDGNYIYLKSAELYDSANGSWTMTGGSLGAGRYQPTATLLANGKILVAGGISSNGTNYTSATAELYNPITGSWSATGNLNVARQEHTAVLLPSGNVLVLGGENSAGNPLASAELYDAGSGTWTITGSLNTARSQHTTTLLPDGKVLVVGGGVGAEVYDPAIGSWAPTTSLGSPRYRHTATLLPNGKVLVAGGRNSPFGVQWSASAQQYDPVSGTWTSAGSLGTPRGLHTATLLPSGKVLVAGGYGGSAYLSGSELYDPAYGTWSATASLSSARDFHRATLLPDGKVLVVGGHASGGNLSSAELYDPANGIWSATASLITARGFHTATLLPTGKVLVAGGQDPNGAFPSSTELYDLGLNFFQPNWQPQIATVPPTLQSGSRLTLTGTRFQGISQASSGNYNDSSSNYPIVQLRSIDNSQVAFLPVDPVAGWSDTAFTSTPVTGLPLGPALVTVFTNGIQSDSKYLVLTKASTSIATQASATVPAGSSISDTATLSNGSVPTGSVTFQLFGPNDATCGGGAIFTSTKNVTGNGSYTSNSFTPTVSGTYRWVATYSGDTNNGPVAGSCNDPNETVSVTPAAATHFSVITPPSVKTGMAFSFTVAALDQFNNTVTGYTGTVHFSSAPLASLPANSTLINGTRTFNATLYGHGNRTIIATDTVNSSVTGISNHMTVHP